MRCKIDENIPVEACALFRQAGHDCESVFDERLAGCSDMRIIQACIEEDRVLLTLDMDFADIRTYPPGTHPGIIIVRIFRQDKFELLRIFRKLNTLLKNHSPAGNLWILEPQRLRIRTCPTSIVP